MASKATRTAVIAVSALGASGLVATSAQAAAPSIPASLVNQPTVAGVVDLTPESATLTGVLDTGGNPQSSFQLAPGTTLSWDQSFNLINSGTSPVTEYVDGLPTNGGYHSYPTNQSTVLYPNGADNYSSVLFEYDPYSDYVANGDHPGGETSFGSDFDVPTSAGLTPVAQTVGGYPAAKATGISGALTPGTKYVYFLVQQAGITDAAQTINTYNGSATGTNPTWSCYPDSYISAVAPYNGFTTSGTISGGVNSSGAAQTTPQPEIQGPCVYYYGGSANYYDSTVGTFTTPKLGSVAFGTAKVTATKTTSGTKMTYSNVAATIAAANRSIEATKGQVELDSSGKAVATSSNYSIGSFRTQTLALHLTAYGKSLIAKGKAFTAKVVYTTTTDQPTVTKTVSFPAA